MDSIFVKEHYSKYHVDVSIHHFFLIFLWTNLIISCFNFVDYHINNNYDLFLKYICQHIILEVTTSTTSIPP
jgi:hypothetical protein